MKRTFLQLAAAGIVVSIAVAACGPSGSGTNSPSPSTAAKTAAAASPSATTATTASATAMSKAADLRVALNLLLLDHVYITAQATDQALIGNDAGFKAAAATLDKNTVGLGNAIGSVYGDAAKTTFLELWRKHVGFFVSLTKGVAAKDQAMQDKAKADLDGYRKDFDAFIAGANPNLPKGAVAELLIPHITGITAFIVDQSTKADKTFDDVETAANHSQKVADPLAEAIVKQYSDKFPGK